MSVCVASCSMLCSHRFFCVIICHKTLAAWSEAIAVATAIIHLCSLSKLWVSFNVKIKSSWKFKWIFCVDKWLTWLLCAIAAADTLFITFNWPVFFSLMNSFQCCCTTAPHIIHSYIHSTHTYVVHSLVKCTYLTVYVKTFNILAGI